MARTKQTARISTIGLRPQRQLSRLLYSEDNQNTQIEIFKATNRRTISVEGTAEFSGTPDSIHLSFLIEESAPSLTDSVNQVIAKLAEVRALATSCGVCNDDISSDSICSKLERTEFRNYHNSEDRSNEQEQEQYEVESIRTTYKARSVLRINLGGDEVGDLFSKVCLSIISAGIRSYQAPVYESTKITEQRNVAREEACLNAKEKALRIVQALEEDTVKLGAPISLTDIHCDIHDDSHDSFLGNTEESLFISTKPAPGGDAEEATRAAKKARVDDGAPVTQSLDAKVASQIFVVPPIRIAARVRAIFEIVTDSSRENESTVSGDAGMAF